MPSPLQTIRQRRKLRKQSWLARVLRRNTPHVPHPRACSAAVWLAALVWLDAGDSAPNRFPSVLAAKSSATSRSKSQAMSTAGVKTLLQ